MLYLLTAIGMIAVVVLLWRAFASERLGTDSREASRPVAAPDDDPEFLRKLDEKNRKRPEEDGRNDR